MHGREPLDRARDQTPLRPKVLGSDEQVQDLLVLQPPRQASCVSSLLNPPPASLDELPFPSVSPCFSEWGQLMNQHPRDAAKSVVSQILI